MSHVGYQEGHGFEVWAVSSDQLPVTCAKQVISDLAAAERAIIELRECLEQINTMPWAIVRDRIAFAEHARTRVINARFLWEEAEARAKHFNNKRG